MTPWHDHKLKAGVQYLINRWKIFLHCEYFCLCLSFPVIPSGFLMAKCINCNFNNFPGAVGGLCHDAAYSWWALNSTFCYQQVNTAFLFCYICAPVRGLLLWRAFYLIFVMKFVIFLKFFQCVSVTEEEAFFDLTIKAMLNLMNLAVASWAWIVPVFSRDLMVLLNECLLSLSQVWRYW